MTDSVFVVLTWKTFCTHYYSIQSPGTGELVYVKEGSNSQHYPLGKVMELVKGKDGQVREVKYGWRRTPKETRKCSHTF